MAPRLPLENLKPLKPIRAESPGDVIFNGNNNEFVITGAFIVLDGLIFQNRNKGDRDATRMR